MMYPYLESPRAKAILQEWADENTRIMKELYHDLAVACAHTTSSLPPSSSITTPPSPPVDSPSALQPPSGPRWFPPPWEDTFLGRESRMSEEEFWEKVGLND